MKPCPFCGSTAILEACSTEPNAYPGSMRVRCSQFCCVMPSAAGLDVEERVIAQWDKRFAPAESIPTDEEVLLREAKDVAASWTAAMEANRAGWAAIAASRTVSRYSTPPPIPPPIPTKLRIIAERMGWLTKSS